MFPKNITVDSINSFSKDTLLSHLDIEFIKLERDSLVAKMPVNSSTHNQWVFCMVEQVFL